MLGGGSDIELLWESALELLGTPPVIFDQLGGKITITFTSISETPMSEYTPPPSTLLSIHSPTPKLTRAMKSRIDDPSIYNDYTFDTATEALPVRKGSNQRVSSLEGDYSTALAPVNAISNTGYN